MEGMLWGVAAMCVKDAVKNPYLKGRDYERNVRQVYRDVDNLKITMDHVKKNCGDEDLVHGPHAPYIKRSERQLKDAYRTLKKDYPRKAGLTKLLEHAATPGAEMILLDIGKEANQTARGLGDLLSEIRFARMGGPKDEDDGASSKASPRSSPKVSPSATSRRPYDMDMYDNAVSDGSSTPRSVASDHIFDRAMIRSSSVHTPSSSTSSRSRKHSSSRRPRSHSHHASRRPSPSSSLITKPHRLDVILESGAEREQALDNLQVGIDKVLTAPDAEHEDEAMEFMEHALAEVLRLQKTQGFTGSAFDEDLGDAVEDLDVSMNALLEAKGEKEKKYAMKRLSHALEDVDHALGERARHKDRATEKRLKRLAEESMPKALPTHTQQPPTRGSLRRQNTDDGTKKTRRYSMYK